ncbi:MAG: hypothetical protein HY078_16445 [Elusimicrobia bacterium]|nr:hypothetical protein [Elusimicrobiota bacterium]
MKSMAESWKIARLSARLLLRHPFLFAYLGATALGVALLMGGALLPVVRHNMTNRVEGESRQILLPYATVDYAALDKHPEGNRFSYVHPNWSVVAVGAAAVYLPGTWLIVFFNIAFLLSVRRLLNGQPASFSQGLYAAWERRAEITKWAVFSATVMMVIELARNVSENWLTRRLLGAINLGWTLATFLAIPVLAVEGGAPIPAIRRSAELFRRTWGQTLAAGVGLGALNAILFVALGAVPAIALFIVGINALVGNGGGWSMLAMMLGLLWMPTALVLISIVSGVASNVFRMALYVYATEGVIPEEYREEDCAWFVARKT